MSRAEPGLSADMRGTVAAEGGAALFAAKVVITIAALMVIAWGIPMAAFVFGGVR